MQLKKSIQHSLMAFALLCVPMAFAACSNDTAKDTVLVVNNGELEASINRLGGQLEIPVETNGSWTMGMDDDECDWAQTWTSGGENGDILTLNVDYFDPRNQQQNRQTTLTISSGNEKRQITLRQYIGLADGETADNASTEPYPDLWQSKGVGMGMNATTGKASDFVLNPVGMIALKKSNPMLYGTIFTQTTEPHTLNDIVQTDTLEDNVRGLGVHCNVNVKYAQFKLNLTVDYKNLGKQIEHAKQYQSTQDLAFLSSTASVPTVAVLIENDLEEVTKRGKQKYQLKQGGLGETLVNVGFQNVYCNIMKAFDDENTSAFQNAVDAMLDRYGPVIIDGATLGGSVFTAVEYDSVFVADSIDIGGKLTTDVSVAAIKIGANVDVKYQQIGNTVWENSHHYCEASGGDKAALTALGNVMGNNFIDRKALNDAATTWLGSIVSSNDDTDNTSLIKCRYTAIWNIFPDEVAQAIKPLVVKYYKGKTLCTIKPEDMGFTKDDLKE